jgi:hypothetical protein
MGGGGGQAVSTGEKQGFRCNHEDGDSEWFPEKENDSRLMSTSGEG